MRLSSPLVLVILLTSSAEGQGLVRNLFNTFSRMAGEMESMRMVSNGTRSFMDTLSMGLKAFNDKVLSSPLMMGVCDKYACGGWTWLCVLVL